jgi:hypothetical protein
MDIQHTVHIYKLHIYKLQVTNYKFLQSYNLQIISYKLQFRQIYKLLVTITSYVIFTITSQRITITITIQRITILLKNFFMSALFNILLERGVNFVLLPRKEKKLIFDVSSFSSKRIIKIQKFSI